MNDRVACAERRAALKRAIATLTDRQNAVLTMLISDDEPDYKTISRVLGIPVGAIGPTRARAIARLCGHGGLAAAVRDSR